MCRRTRNLRPAGSAAIIAGIGLFTAYLVPAVKYTQPPGTSDPDTLDERTLLRLAMLAISIVVTVAVAVGTAMVILAWTLLPSVDETPPISPHRNCGATGRRSR